MLIRRSFAAVSRRTFIRAPIARSFATSSIRCYADSKADKGGEGRMVPFEEVKSEADLRPPGAAPGTVPTDIEQSTGLERLEILGKMQGIDIFDMRPLDASRLGTMSDPIMVKSAGDEQYVGCTGCPVDSHVAVWLTITKERPIGRCTECGSVYKMEYVGPEHDAHHDHHDHHADPALEEPKTFADYVKTEYH